MFAHARVLREIARQGFLPFPAFFVSIRPFGTPLAPVSLKLLITVMIILAAPAADAVNLLLDLSVYPALVSPRRFTQITPLPPASSLLNES